MATADFNTINISDTFDSLDDQLTAAEAICDAVAVLVALDGAQSPSDEQALKVHNGTLAALLRHAATLLNVANAEAYSLKHQALGFVNSLENKAG